MVVPASVTQLLEQQNVTYSITPTQAVTSADPGTPREQQLRQAGAAKSLILQDGEGRVQVVIPADCLLDLQAVQTLLKRTLKPASREELRSFYSKYQLDSVPALPRLGSMPTLMDQRLLQRERVLLDSGSEALLDIDRLTFERLVGEQVASLAVGKVLVGDVCVPLADLESRFQAADDDEQAICNAVTSFTGKRIKQRLEETLELPPLPETAQKIIQLRVDPNADVSDLANIVETDPSLAAQVVSWASSPYYSAPGKIRSIHDAIVRVLGFDMVLNLALGLALGKTLSMPEDSPHGATSYWRQAVYTAAAVEALVTAIPRDKRPGFGMAYLSGLLHNFGWLVLAELFPPQFASICRLLEANTHVPAHLVEFHVLGTSRDQIAGWLMQLWNMPEEVVVALRQQNNGEAAMEHSEYARLVFIAKRLLLNHGIGESVCTSIPADLFRQLNLEAESARQTVATILESSADLDNIALKMQA